ncbi:MAG: hypothetical protein BM565_05155 [Gammaproteobacteria bacterium MedPE]|nr:MAG: hypothetical protein BM565_05155 [Gammaproteobacteria bacterium MedPE]
MFRKLAILGWLTFSCFSLVASELTPEQANEYLKIPDTFSTSGEFVQHKHFKILDKPFVSSGFFKNEGDTFEWTTLVPVTSALIFDGKTLWQQESDGQLKPLLLAGHYIVVVEALVTGDIKRLGDFFRFETYQKTSCLKLLPKDKQMALIAKTIDFCYENSQLKVQLNESEGNYTTIDISLAAIDDKTRD